MPKAVFPIVIIVLAAGLGVWYFMMSEPPASTLTNTVTNTVTNTATNGSTAGTTLVPTSCPTAFVVSQTEGPYYTAGSPERTNIVDEGTPGESLTVSGVVYDQDCNPIAGAWIDFWQANGEGNYDNSGYNLRGHQLTDANGVYILQTVKPADYGTRTAHIHVKLAPTKGGSVTTSQLYFPGASSNATDSIYDAAQLVTYDAEDPSIAYFNFKIDTE